MYFPFTSPWKLIFVFNFYLPGAYVLEMPQAFLLKHNEVEDQHLAVLQWLILNSQVEPYLLLDISGFGESQWLFSYWLSLGVKYSIYNRYCENYCTLPLSFCLSQFFCWLCKPENTHRAIKNSGISYNKELTWIIAFNSQKQIYTP